MDHTIVLLVDVQQALIEENPFNKDGFVLKLKKLIDAARHSDMEIVYIQHDGGRADPLAYGSRGWQFIQEIAPKDGDKVFHKRKNSAFKETGLHSYLQARQVDTIILVGMQTEYCIDATCKSAFDLDYSLIIPQGCTTTFDNDYFTGQTLSEYYEEKIWNRRFARVMPVDQVIFNMSMGPG